jgi:glycosyltransferase involved in cell wall biosynthesis
MEELLHSAEQMGHSADFISTNGTKGMMYWGEQRVAEAMLSERRMIKAGTPYDIDIVFTAPQNFPQRFLNSSRVKIALYDYESSHMPAHWKKYYSIVDFVIPSSNYVAQMFKRNGCPEEKIRAVHHGIDPSIFNADAIPLKIDSEKKFKFLCVAAPHYRKQITNLLDVYCESFTSNDDVSLVLKTKFFNNKKEMKPFEVDVRSHLNLLKSRMGDKMPEVVVIDKKIDNMASLYTACDAFALMTASEGWGMPFLESIACGTPVIAPRFGGQLDFLNDNNAILTKCGTRKAKPVEQYWGVTPGATTGHPDSKDFASKMRYVYENITDIRGRLSGEMRRTAEGLTWQSAMEKIIEIGRAHV